MGTRSIGRWFGVVAQLSSMAYASCALVSYVILIGDLLVGDGTGLFSQWAAHSVLDGSGIEARAIACFGVSICVLYPLCCSRSLDSLKWTSWISLAATLLCLLVLLNEAAYMPESSFQGDEKKRTRSHIDWIEYTHGLWQALPVINVAFAAHENAPRYYEELGGRTSKRFIAIIVSHLQSNYDLSDS